jgi:hypothetical protein
VAEVKPPTGVPQSGSDERELAPETTERDVLFQAQMAVANFFLGYYKYGLVVMGLVLLGALVVGVVNTTQTNAQRAIHAKIAAAQLDLTDPEDKVQLAKVAKNLEGIAVEGDGTAAIMALLQAAEVFRAADQREDAMRAYEKAKDLEGKGILQWAAASGLAAEKAAAGDLEGAVAIYRPFTTGDTIEAQDALWSIAVLQQEQAKTDPAKKAEALATLQDLITRFPETRHAEDAGWALKLLSK